MFDDEVMILNIVMRELDRELDADEYGRLKNYFLGRMYVYDIEDSFGEEFLELLRSPVTEDFSREKDRIIRIANDLLLTYFPEDDSDTDWVSDSDTDID